MRASVAIAVVLAATTAARADTEADKLFQEGRALLDAKDYDGACKKFQAAYSKDTQAPGTMLNLGLCHEHLNPPQFAAALRWYHRAADRASNLHMDPEYVKAAQAHAQDLSTRVAFIRIAIATPVENVVVKIDGAELRKDELDEYAVDPGPHKLLAKAPGMKIYRKDFAIISTTDQGQAVEVKFERGDSAIVVDRGKTRRLAAIGIAVGGGLLMGIAGIYSAAYAHDDSLLKQDHPECFGGSPGPQSCGGVAGQPNGPYTAGTPYALAATYHNNLKTTGTALFTVGAVAAAAGIVLYLTAPSKERREEIVLAPVLAADHVGVAAVGRF